MANLILNRRKVKKHRRFKLPQHKTQFRGGRISINGEIEKENIYISEKVNKGRRMGVAVQASSSRNLLRWLPLGGENLRTYMRNPKQIPPSRKDLIEVGRDGIFRPLYVPNLADTSSLPTSLKTTLEMEVNNRPSHEVEGTMQLIQHLTRKEIPCDIEVIELIKEYMYEMLSWCNDIKIFKLSSSYLNTLLFHINVKDLTVNPIDGRETSINFEAKHRNETVGNLLQNPPKKQEDDPWFILLWNCRGMSRTTFPAMFEMISKELNPDVVILTEIRVTNFICKRILEGNRYCKNVEVVEGAGCVGGISIISGERTHLVIELETRLPNCCSGRIMKWM